MGNIVYPLSIWKIWIIQSISCYFLSSYYVCFDTRDGFTLETVYEIWKRKFSKVMEFRFKSCFQHLPVVNLGQVSQPFYTSVSSFAKRGWYLCSARTRVWCHRLANSDCLHDSSWLWCLSALCTFILSLSLSLSFFLIIYLFWLHWVFVAARGLFL